MSERITPRIDWLTVDELDEARAAAGHCAAAVADVLIAATVGTLADQFGTARLDDPQPPIAGLIRDWTLAAAFRAS